MPTMPSPVTIPDTERRMLSSSVVDQEFSIYVALPYSYTKESKAYPVVYVLDANGMFGMVTETVRLLAYEGLPDDIIVGIGYPVGTYTATLGLRTRDMTPTEVDAAWYDEFISHFSEQPAYAGAGGAAHFLRIIREELMPLVNTNYRTMPEDSMLMGDSFGGLFSLYALFSQPDTFQRYVIGSPSVWWDNEVILRFEKDFAA
jgi:predicted alpha/beta superfamily hydrolase